VEEVSWWTPYTKSFHGLSVTGAFPKIMSNFGSFIGKSIHWNEYFYAYLLVSIGQRSKKEGGGYKTVMRAKASVTEAKLTITPRLTCSNE
jgi:hypothetical protein